MFASDDKHLNIEVVKNYSGYVLQPADWSIFNFPKTQDDARHLADAYRQLKESSKNHIAVGVCAHSTPREEIESLSHVSDFIARSKFGHTDTVHVVYEGTTQRHCSRLTPIACSGFVLSFRDKLDYKSTTWFNSEFANATNAWDVTKHTLPDSTQEPVCKTKWGMFAWEIGLLMIGLSAPRMYSTFLYLGNPDKSLLSFIKTFGQTCFVYMSDEQEAIKTINEYNEMEVPSGKDVSRR